MIFGIGFSSRWAHLPRQLLPAFITVLLLIVQLLPWSRGADAMTPSLLLMSVFFWCVRAPKLMPLFFVFVLGVIADLTELTPLGSQAIILSVLCIELARRRARFAGLGFLRLWVLFASLCLIVNIMLWVVELAVGGHIMPLGQAFARTAIACIVYPVITWAILMPVDHLVKDHENG